MTAASPVNTPCHLGGLSFYAPRETLRSRPLTGGHHFSYPTPTLDYFLFPLCIYMHIYISTHIYSGGSSKGNVLVGTHFENRREEKNNVLVLSTPIRNRSASPKALILCNLMSDAPRVGAKPDATPHVFELYVCQSPGFQYKQTAGQPYPAECRPLLSFRSLGSTYFEPLPPGP
jgi:hypothetical protein